MYKCITHIIISGGRDSAVCCSPVILLQIGKGLDFYKGHSPLSGRRYAPSSGTPDLVPDWPLSGSPSDPCPGPLWPSDMHPHQGPLSGSTLTEWVCKPPPHKPTHPELGWGSVCHQDILPGRDRLRGEWDLALVISHPPQKREDGEYGKSNSWGGVGGKMPHSSLWTHSRHTTVFPSHQLHARMALTLSIAPFTLGV